MALPLAVFFILTSCLLTGAVSEDGACSEIRRSSNLAGCLSKVRQIAGNSSYFWFGSVHAAKCPSDLKRTINCYNPHQGVKTLSDLTFGVDNAYISLDRYVDVKYTSAPGSYVGCDHTFTQNSTVEFTVDPLSNTAIPSWDLRAMPEVTWTANQYDLFTLIVLDVGYGWLHGLYVNIPGNMVSNGEAVKAYQGPQNARNVANPYAFVLYKQPSPINKNSISLAPSPPFNVTKAAQIYKFGDLVGLSWVLASYDAYAMKLRAAVGSMQNCADLVSKAYQNHPRRPFLPYPLDLSVYLRLQFSEDATTYPCGNESKTLVAEDFFVDPIGMPLLNTIKARTEATKTFSIQMNKMFPNDTKDFIGKMYTLMVVDADLPSKLSFIGSNATPILHGMTINIKEADFTSGFDIMPYFGPAPTDPNTHFYYFLLYEQLARIDLTNTVDYTDRGRCNDIPKLKDRCQFEVTSFVSTNNLKLVGATWLTATADEYVVCQNKASPTSPSVLLLLLLLLPTFWMI